MSKEEKPKLGAGHLAAMGRQGLAELRAALYPESNVAQPPGPGIYGTSTQREAYEARFANSMLQSEDPSPAEKEPEAHVTTATVDPGREPPEAERGH